MAQSREKFSLSAERLYLDLLYCRADARACDLPYVEHLLNLACEELQKLSEADMCAVQPDWNEFHVYPGMK